MKKIVTLIFVLVLLNSCIKELVFDYDDVETQVVVNALFTEDEPWNVMLTLSKDAEDSTDVYVENATVSIFSDDEEIVLNYSGDGEYTSESCPKAEITYSLKVEVPGYETITASSSVPAKPECDIEPFDTTFSKYMFLGDLCDYIVMPLSVNLNSTEASYYLMGFEGYHPEYRYFYTEESISNLREDGLPEDILAVFDSLVGLYFDSQYFVYDYLLPFKDEYGTKYYSKAVKEVLSERVEEYDPDRFFAICIWSACVWLDNISAYSYAIIGENTNYTDADIYLGDQDLSRYVLSETKQDLEYWLKVRTCSPEFYNYYKSYVIQVSQRYNSYADAIEVDTNIENGYGIFAGYNQQKIHFLDY
jgi:hypothetical protein